MSSADRSRLAQEASSITVCLRIKVDVSWRRRRSFGELVDTHFNAEKVFISTRMVNLHFASYVVAMSGNFSTL